MNNMPRKEINDYVFYKIVCLDDSVELCYVGSTANFNKRKNKHKNRCNNENNENNKNYNLKIYKNIRENGGWNNFKMIQIGTREQLTIRQAEQIEEEYRVELKANMNDRRCYRSEELKKELIKEYSKEYREKNKEQIKKREKEYREKNKEVLAEKQKEYREDNKEIIAEKYKEYREQNKEALSKYSKEYKQKNKEQIKEKSKEKITCECGCIIRKSDLSKHKKTNKHLALIEKNL